MMLSRLMTKSYIALLIIVSFKEFAKCKDDLEFWERDPKFWGRDAKTTTSRIKIIKNSGKQSGRRQEPPVEYLKVPYSRDGDNLFAADYKMEEGKSQSKNRAKTRQESNRPQSTSDVHNVGINRDDNNINLRASDRNRIGSGRDGGRNRDYPSKNKKEYGNNGYGRNREYGHNRDYDDNRGMALDIPGKGKGIGYDRPTRNKKDSGGYGRGQSIVDSKEKYADTRGKIKDDRNRDRGWSKNDNTRSKNTGDRYMPGKPKIGSKSVTRLEHGKENARLDHGKQFDNKDDAHLSRGKRIESKGEDRTGRGRVTMGQHNTRFSDQGRLNKGDNRGYGGGGWNKDTEGRPGRSGRIDDRDEKPGRNSGRGRPIKDKDEGLGRGGRIDDYDDESKPGRGRPLKDRDEGLGRGGRIDVYDEEREPGRSRPVKNKDERLGYGERIDDIDEKRKPIRSKSLKDIEAQHSRDVRIDSRDEKRKPNRAVPKKDIETPLGRGGRIDYMDEKRKPGAGRNRPMPVVQQSHYGQKYDKKDDERHTTRRGPPFAGSYKDGPGRSGMISDMEDRRGPGHGKVVVDGGRGPNRNKRGPDKKVQNVVQVGNGRGHNKKIARDPTYKTEIKDSGKSKHKTTKKRGHDHFKEAITKGYSQKDRPRVTKGLADDHDDDPKPEKLDLDHAYDNGDDTADSQEEIKIKPLIKGPHREGHKLKKQNYDQLQDDGNDSEDRKDKKKKNEKPIGAGDLPELSPHSIAKQLICIAQKNKNASIVQENIGRTSEYRDIIMWKMKENQYFRSNNYFRANDDKKYVDEGPEKKIILIVHGLSVMGWNELPCLSRKDKFQTLLSYYIENLDSFDIFLIPMANPDGVAASNKKNPYWNKNMSPQKACPGVALDRNFDVAWNVSRTVNSCNGQYPGPAPFSEVETQAIREVFHRYGHKIVGYFHVHAGTHDSKSFKGDAVLYPKGYAETQSDDDKYIDLKGEIDEALRNASFKVLSVSVDTLYNWYGQVAGTGVDYASSIYGIPYALELVMQLYEDDPQKPPEKREQHLALTEIWQMLLDVIFDHIYRSVVKNKENE